MSWFRQMFGARRAVIGVVHLPPLPGSPRASLGPSDIERRALADGRALAAAGVHGLIVENHGDAPFHAAVVPPHVPALMAVLARRLLERTGLPVGINILRNDAMAALGTALAAGGSFIRVNVLSGVTATDQGLITGHAAEVLRYRRAIAPSVRILADVRVKFGTPVWDPPLPTLVTSTLRRALADAIIVTGEATGSPVDRAELALARRHAGRSPVLVGSGATADSAPDLLRSADGLIVGTAFRRGGDVEAPVDPARVRRFMRAIARLTER